MAFGSFMNGHEDIYSLSGFFIGAKNSVKRRAYQKRMIFSTLHWISFAFWTAPQSH